MSGAREYELGGRRLTLAVAVSLAAHLLAAIALAARPGPGEAGADPLHEVRPDPDRVKLGIRDSEATTITWIGFEDPTPHQARQATVEQAAQQIGGGQASPRPTSRPAPAARPRPTETPAEAAPSPVRTPEVSERPDTSFPLPAPAEDAPDEDAAPNEDAPPSEEETPAQPSPQEPAETPGNAERESDAVSLKKPLKIEWGRPVAAEGLEILTRKKGPAYSAFTRSTSGRKVPLVEIWFGRDGLVKAVEMVRSSGNPDIDRPLKDALYTWRARGERIDLLEGEAVVKVRMRIIVEF